MIGGNTSMRTRMLRSADMTGRHVQEPLKMGPESTALIAGFRSGGSEGRPTQAAFIAVDDEGREVLRKLEKLQWLRPNFCSDQSDRQTFAFAIALSTSPEARERALDELARLDAVVRVLVTGHDHVEPAVSNASAVIVVDSGEQAVAGIRALVEPIWRRGWVGLDSTDIASTIHGRTCRQVAVAEFSGSLDLCVKQVSSQLERQTSTSNDRLYINFLVGGLAAPTLQTADQTIHEIAERAANQADVVFGMPVSQSGRISVVTAMIFR